MKTTDDIKHLHRISQRIAGQIEYCRDAEIIDPDEAEFLLKRLRKK